MGEGAPIYTQAIVVAQKLTDPKLGYRGPLSFVGHSLGGGLATAQALVTNHQAFIFNPAGVHQKTLDPYKVDFTHVDQLVFALNTEGDPLQFAQTHKTEIGVAALAIKKLVESHVGLSPANDPIDRIIVKAMVNAPPIRGTRALVPDERPYWQGNGHLLMQSPSSPLPLVQEALYGHSMTDVISGSHYVLVSPRYNWTNKKE